MSSKTPKRHRRDFMALLLVTVVALVAVWALLEASTDFGVKVVRHTGRRSRPRRQGIR